MKYNAETLDWAIEFWRDKGGDFVAQLAYGQEAADDVLSITVLLTAAEIELGRLKRDNKPIHGMPELRGEGVKDAQTARSGSGSSVVGGNAEGSNDEEREAAPVQPDLSVRPSHDGAVRMNCGIHCSSARCKCHEIPCENWKHVNERH